MADWYNEFIGEARAIITESVYASREELLRGKWELGKLLSDNNSNFEREQIYGDRVVSRVAADLKRSSSDIWRCLQFYKMLPSETFSQAFEKLPDGKNISWFKVITKLLPKETTAKKKQTLFITIDLDSKETVINDYFSIANLMDERIKVKIFVER